MILQIDMGNTRIKWRLQSQLRTLFEGVELTGSGWSWLASLAEHGAKAIHVSSVLSDESNRQLLSMCYTLGYPTPLFAKTQSSVSIGQERLLMNGYDQPGLLGVDRWLVLLAARKHTKSSCVVVDAGSALTVDIIDESGRHLGGYVAPGLKMMRESLQSGAVGLAGSVLGLNGLDYSAPGTNTQGCVDAALLHMGRGLICAATEKASNGALYITGGDALAWLAMFNGAISMPDMVLDGLGCYFE